MGDTTALENPPSKGYLVAMNTHQKIISTFYTAFTKKDVENMVGLYADDVVFQDPAFGTLHGKRARDMWRMLISSQKGKDFDVRFHSVTATATGGTAHWTASYVFSQTGRKVVNEIDATFVIVDGKIVKHTDTFPLRKWAHQAMGFKGWLLGGTAFFRKKLQAQTNGMLDKWVGRHQ